MSEVSQKDMTQALYDSGEVAKMVEDGTMSAEQAGLSASGETGENKSPNTTTEGQNNQDGQDAGQKSDDNNPQPAQDGGGNNDDDGSSNKKKNSNIENLLRQRNKARNEAKSKDDYIKELEAKLGDKKSQNEKWDKGGESQYGNDDIDSKIDKRIQDLQEQNRMEQEDAKDKQSMLDKYPQSADRLEEVEKVRGVAPSLSYEAALRVVAPELVVTPADEAPTQKGPGFGGNSSPDAYSDKSPEDMTQDELEKELRSEIAQGNVRI